MVYKYVFIDNPDVPIINTTLTALKRFAFKTVLYPLRPCFPNYDGQVEYRRNNLYMPGGGKPNKF
jgi:hypothetical protein